MPILETILMVNMLITILMFEVKRNTGYSYRREKLTSLYFQKYKRRVFSREHATTNRLQTVVVVSRRF
jgi:hypothetical protein